jgi:hypothetical protein
MAILLLLGAAKASADRYILDPVVTANLRVVDAPLSTTGGTIDVPASDGVSAVLSYGANDACSGSTIHIGGLGPIGIDHLMIWHSIYPRDGTGWQPFYEMTLSISQTCGSKEFLTFNGFPKLRLIIPNAKAGTTYYSDMALEAGNDAHIPLGPPEESNAKDIVFDFKYLPEWAKNGQQLRVPIEPIYRFTAVRQ